MKLGFCDPTFALFASAVLDETDDDYAPPRSGAFMGLKEYVSAVHVRAAARAVSVSKRGRRAS